MSHLEQALSHTTPTYQGPWNGQAHRLLEAAWKDGVIQDTQTADATRMCGLSALPVAEELR